MTTLSRKARLAVTVIVTLLCYGCGGRNERSPQLAPSLPSQPPSVPSDPGPGQPSVLPQHLDLRGYWGEPEPRVQVRQFGQTRFVQFRAHVLVELDSPDPELATWIELDQHERIKWVSPYWGQGGRGCDLDLVQVSRPSQSELWINLDIWAWEPAGSRECEWLLGALHTQTLQWELTDVPVFRNRPIELLSLTVKP